MKKIVLILALMSAITPANGEDISLTNKHHHALNHPDSNKIVEPVNGHILGTGKVVSVNAAKQTIKIKHDPIKALNWPVMTMSFTVERGLKLTDIKAGDSVTFTLKPDNKEGYIIATLSKN
jgi:Cu(I)/Ag(I) efflux system protein CusF